MNATSTKIELQELFPRHEADDQNQLRRFTGAVLISLALWGLLFFAYSYLSG